MALLNRIRIPAPSQWFDSVKGCLATWVELVRTRVELVATELEEEKARLTQIILLAIVAVFSASLAAVMLTFLLVAGFWNTPYRMVVVGGVTLLYFLVAGGAALALWMKIKSKPKIFAATIQELSKDKDYLTS